MEKQKMDINDLGAFNGSLDENDVKRFDDHFVRLASGNNEAILRRVLLSVLNKPFTEFRQHLHHADDDIKDYFINLMQSGEDYIESLQTVLELLKIAQSRLETCFKHPH